jgi:hypothetical protein
VTSNKQIPLRPLGILKTLLEGLSFEITHCYEDLIFIESNVFLLRMEAQGEDVSLFFNTDSEVEKRDEVGKMLRNTGKKQSLNISSSGTFQMTADEHDGTITLEFQDS